MFLLYLLIVASSIFSNPSSAQQKPEARFPCKPPQHSSYTFCNTSLPTPTRAQSLVSLLTLQEKVEQLSNTASAIPRLGVPAYQWWSEALHGIASNGPGVSFNGTIRSATGFPQVLGAAASFNRTLWFLIGSAVAVEARSMYNMGQAGLTFWAPNINVFRDPRWGRGQETPGEDPLVVSEYGVQFVRGFQGRSWRGVKRRRVLVDDDDDDGLMLSACCKHFTAYDLEKWKDFSRYSFNAVVTEQDMEDTYQPPFRSCIQDGKASCLMCSYNAVNGVPACAKKDLLEKARSDWGFKGYITSDCDAVATVLEYQNYTKTPEDTVADVLKAGVDINCGTYLLLHTISAIDNGKMQEKDIDIALVNLFSVQIRLGLFDGDFRKGDFGKLGPQNVCTSEHRTLALETARQGIVLLKNENKFLPLNKNAVSSLAVIGPFADDISQMGGGYTGVPCNPKSLLEGFKPYVKKTSYAAGCHNISCNSDMEFDEAILAAKEADHVIIVAGLDLTQETEDLDRVSLLLPGKQMSLVSSIAAVSKKPVVLVLTGGGPLDVSFAEGNPKIGSILWIGYPGEAGGKALAEVVFGDYNPGGRLPMTWYPESFTNVPMNDMNMRTDPSRGYPGRTYRFYTGSKVYRFGHGLSYSTFTYKIVSAPKKLTVPRTSNFSPNQNILQDGDGLEFLHVDGISSCSSLIFNVGISVTNDGDMDGSHVVMLFSQSSRVLAGTPEKQLIGFDRVHAMSRGYTETSFLVDPCKHLSFADESGKRVLPLGNHVMMVGDLEHSFSVETF